MATSDEVSSQLGADMSFSCANTSTDPISTNTEAVKEIEALPEDSADFSLDIERPDIAEEVALGSSFQSPKVTAEGTMSETCLEGGEFIKTTGKTNLNNSEEPVMCVAELCKDNHNGAEHKLSLTNEQDLEKPETKEFAGDIVAVYSAPLVLQEVPDAPDDSINKIENTDIVPMDNFKMLQEDGDAERACPTTIASSDRTAGAETIEEQIKVSKPGHSVPPHIRADYQQPVPRPCGIRDSTQAIPTFEGPRMSNNYRGARPFHPTYQPSSYRDVVDQEQFARLSAQLMKTKNELDAERKKNINLRKVVTTEQQESMEAASSNLLTSCLREQAEALALRAKVEARERFLNFREQKIEQLEAFLSEGQKQVVYQLEKEGVRTMQTVQLEHIRREAVLATKKDLADAEATLKIRFEDLHLQESAQRLREQQYKGLIRESIESELREKYSTTTEANETKLREQATAATKANDAAEIDYNDGFAVGKEAGRRESAETMHQKGFLEGYAVCHHTQVTLAKSRKGELACNSSTLDFLYDVTHPHNPFVMGEQLGRLETTKKDEDPTNGKVHVQKEIKVDTQLLQETKTTGLKDSKFAEFVRKLPPPRLSFAAQLRGPQTMHNGQVVLANASASPPTTTTSAHPDGGHGVQKGVDTEGDEAEKEVNLIDLLG